MKWALAIALGLAMWTAESVANHLSGLSARCRAEFLRLTAAAPSPVPPLMGFIPQTTPQLESPLHLQEVVDAIEATRRRQVRAIISTPPQHGKTQTIGHGLVWLLKQDPTKRHAYVSYSDDRGKEISLEMQWIAGRAGLDFDGNLGLWTTPQGGSIRCTGIGGGLTGRPIDGVLVIDDPVKNREEAESASHREKTDGWLKSVAIPRVHPGASILVIQTRWHPDDQAGRLETRGGWDCINLPAIRNDGTALWEKGRPLAWLAEQRKEVGEYDWASLYMGAPRLRGNRLFNSAKTYTELPKGYRIAMGLDLAYTAKTSSDHSVAVVMAEHEGLYYVIDVIRRQVKADVFADELVQLQKRFPVAAMRWYCSTTEMGSADILRKLSKINLFGMLATADKFVRAQPVSAAWNLGRVRVPTQAPWLEAYLRVMGGFTGVNDSEDDDVDATAAAFDQLPAHVAPRLPAFGTPEWAEWDREQRLNQVGQQLKRRGRYG